jgi:hypothetical protein
MRLLLSSMRRTAIRGAGVSKPHVLFVEQNKDDYGVAPLEDLPLSRPLGRRIQERPLTIKPHALFTDQERDDCFLDEPLPARPIAKQAQSKPFSAKFNSRWAPKETLPMQTEESVEEEPVEEIEIPVIEPPTLKRAELCGQTPESVLRDIEIMVGRVREICGRRSQ